MLLKFVYFIEIMKPVLSSQRRLKAKQEPSTSIYNIITFASFSLAKK